MADLQSGKTAPAIRRGARGGFALAIRQGLNLKGGKMTETPASRLEKLKQRKAKLDAEIAKAEATEKKAARAKDTRRKILIGAAMLAEIEAEPTFRDGLRRILDRSLTQERDRELLADLLTTGQ